MATVHKALLAGRGRGALSHATELTLVSLRICFEMIGAAVLSRAKKNADRKARVL